MAAAGPRARRPFFFCILFVGAGDRVTRPETETRVAELGYVFTRF